MGALDCVPTNKMQATDSTEVFAVSLSSNLTLNETRKDLESLTAKDSENRRNSIWWTLLVDVPLLAIVVVLIILFELGKLPSYQAGFYCGDPALSFPYRGDTVSSGLLIGTIFLAPIIVILATELIFAEQDYDQRARTVTATRRMAWVYRSYLYGLVFNLAVVEVMKGITGSPRPTFFDVCQPDTAQTCNGSEFVSSFECNSKKFSHWMQRDSYRSFPSGHTSLSVHFGLFLAWYLQKRAFDWRYRTVFVVPALQLLCLSFTVVSSLTRITDHRHHWWDVLVGVVIGVATTAYAALVLCENFTKHRTKSIEDPRLKQPAPTPIFDSRRSDLATP